MQYVVSFSDFILVLKRYRRKILFWTLLFSALGLLFSLNRSVKYLVTASFKERGIANHQSSHSFGSLLKKSSEMQSEANTWFTSHTLMKRLVEELSLHGRIEPLKRPLSYYFNRMINNAKIEYAYLKEVPSPNLSSQGSPLFLEKLLYTGEEAVFLQLSFLNDQDYLVKRRDGKVVGKGKFGKPFATANYSFTLQKEEKVPLEQLTYLLRIDPSDFIAKKLFKKMEFENDSNDGELVFLTTLHQDRKIGASLLNKLISLYKAHKREEQKRVAKEQIAYLKKREQEAETKLIKTMEHYAKEQSKDLATSGFVSSDKALEFLATREMEYQKRLLQIDLETKMLSNVIANGDLFYDRLQIDTLPNAIHPLLTEIRHLKEQGDSLKLSLQESSPSFDESEKLVFNKQIADLEDTGALVVELQAIEKELKKDNLITPSDTLLKDPRLMLESWYEKLQEYRQEFSWSTLSHEQWEGKKRQFAAYVKNLIQLFEVHEKALRERLAHHGDLKEEFKGINLKLSHELLFTYNKELSQIESELIKITFILESLQQPYFELSSLASKLSDPVSRELIANYSKQLLKLQDRTHISEKEQERIQNDLQRQKDFLEMHLTQSLSVLGLTKELARANIHNLQKVSLALIQQKISLLEKQLESFVINRLSNLKDEKGMVEEQLSSIRKEMSTIPNKKISEKILEQNLEKSRDFGREITRLVETKNIGNNLEVILSTPVDHAYPPTLPRRPHLILFTLLGAIFGCLFSTFVYCLKEAIQGIVASPANFREMGFPVAGVLSSKYPKKEGIQPEDLAVIRTAATVCRKEKVSLILGEKAEPFAKDVTKLLKKSGEKTLLIPLLFEERRKSQSEKTLLDYLEGEIESPSIENDTVVTGGHSPYGTELVTSKRFKELLTSFEKEYDKIICYSSKSLASAEGQRLFSQFEQVAILLHDERMEKMEPALQKTESKTLSFVWSSIS